MTSRDRKRKKVITRRWSSPATTALQSRKTVPEAKAVLSWVLVRACHSNASCVIYGLLPPQMRRSHDEARSDFM